MIKAKCLVAHRGQSFTMPENTIESIREAIACGASAVEFDVQMTGDFIPVVSHDMSLMRAGNTDINIDMVSYAELIKLNVNESARLGDIHQIVSLPSLQDMVALLKENPRMIVFVELKEDSIA